MERTLNGATNQTVKLIEQMSALTSDLPDALQREVEAVIHKMAHPMKEILAKVPGSSLTERAKRLKVSRQTIYVWESEKYRPTRIQAKRIARVTGVPLDHIFHDGAEVKRVARRKAHKKAARMAKGRKKVARSNRGTTPKRRRKGDSGDGIVAA